MWFGIDQRRRKSLCGERTTFTAVVSGDTTRQVLGVADVEGVIRATENVDVKHDDDDGIVSPSTRPAASLRAFSLPGLP